MWNYTPTEQKFISKCFLERRQKLQKAKTESKNGKDKVQIRREGI